MQVIRKTNDFTQSALLSIAPSFRLRGKKKNKASNAASPPPRHVKLALRRAILRCSSEGSGFPPRGGGTSRVADTPLPPHGTLIPFPLHRDAGSPLPGLPGHADPPPHGAGRAG